MREASKLSKALLLASERLWWTELCPPPHSYVEALTPNVTIFGDRVFKEVIKVK